MLNDAINKYGKRVIGPSKIIEELIGQAIDMNDSYKDGEEKKLMEAVYLKLREQRNSE